MTVLFVTVLTLAPAMAMAQPEPVPAEVVRDTRERVRRAVAAHVQAAGRGEMRGLRIGDEAWSPHRVWAQVAVALPRVADIALVDVFLEEQSQRQIATDRPASDFELAEEPDVSPANGPVERSSRYRARQDRLFDIVFLSPSFDRWSPVTRRSIASDREFETSFFQAVKKGQMPPFWRDLARGWVTNQLRREAEIRYPSHGLPERVAMQVGDYEWPVEDAFAMVKELVEPCEIQAALTAVAIRAALQTELVATGHWLGDQVFREQFDSYAANSLQGAFEIRVIATKLLGFPSLEECRQHWRLMRSFEAMIASELGEEVLAAHARSHCRIAGDATVTVRLFPTSDARELVEGESMPMTLAQLRRAIGENPFTDLVSGASLADYLFADAPLGEPSGPLSCAGGSYMVVVEDRAGVQAAKLEEPSAAARVREDYIRRRFAAWSTDVLIKTVIR